MSADKSKMWQVLFVFLTQVSYSCSAGRWVLFNYTCWLRVFMSIPMIDALFTSLQNVDLERSSASKQIITWDKYLFSFWIGSKPLSLPSVTGHPVSSVQSALEVDELTRWHICFSQKIKDTKTRSEIFSLTTRLVIRVKNSKFIIIKSHRHKA